MRDRFAERLNCEHTLRMNMKRLFLTLVPIFALSSCLSTDFLPPQEGAYGILGTTVFQLDDPRNLVIQAWYPAANIGEGKLDPLLKKEQAEAFVSFLPIGKEQFENRMPSSSYIDAPIMPSTSPYPIIIFDHGFEGYEKQNMTQMENLASNGYVVFSISHPGESFVTVYPDGRIVGIDKERYPSLRAPTKKERKANAAQTNGIISDIREADSDKEKIEIMRLLSSISRISKLKIPIDERTTDVLNFMERLPEMSRQGFFTGAIDIENVGMYGHSMGGNVTHAIASLGEWPVGLKAAANLDGPQLIFPGDKITIPQVPFMMAYSTATYIDGITVNLAGANDWVLSECNYDTWRIVFNGTTHVNFSDLTYAKILEGKSTGKIDGYTMGVALDRLLVAWFDKNLKNQDTDMVRLEQSYDLWELDYHPAK